MTMVTLRPDRTLGDGHDMFWHWCDRDELRMPECTRCGHLAWPIVPECERCGGEAFEWRRLGGGGKLVSACVFEQDYYAGTLPLPYETILVELDEGVMFVANPAGFSGIDAPLGRRVRVRFVDTEDRAGRFRLPVFELA